MPGKKRKRSGSSSHKGRAKRRKSVLQVGPGRGSGYSGGNRSHTILNSFSSRIANQGDQLRIKLRTYISVELTSTSGAAVGYYIKLNSLYRPFTTLGTNHENPTASNLATLYQRYIVVAAALRFRAAPSASYTVPGWLGLHLAGDTATVNTWGATTSEIVESGRGGRYKLIPHLNACDKLVTISDFAYMAALHGMSQEQYLANYWHEGYQTTAAVKADPTVILNGLAFYQSNDGATTTKVVIDMELIQWVIFHGRAPYA